MATRTEGGRTEGGRTEGGHTRHAPAPKSSAKPEVPRWRRKLRPYLLSVPAVLIVIGILYPFFVGAWYSFLNYAAVNPNPVFVGFANFASVLGDAQFWSSVRVTGTFAVVATIVETVLGVILALTAFFDPIQFRPTLTFAANALWPRTTIATAAVRYALGGQAMIDMSRTPDIMADAAHAILTMPSSRTGNFFLDDEVLAETGVTDLSGYAVTPGATEFMPDLFL